jgi:hypothetical protein
MSEVWVLKLIFKKTSIKILISDIAMRSIFHFAGAKLCNSSFFFWEIFLYMHIFFFLLRWKVAEWVLLWTIYNSMSHLSKLIDIHLMQVDS